MILFEILIKNVLNKGSNNSDGVTDKQICDSINYSLIEKKVSNTTFTHFDL